MLEVGIDALGFYSPQYYLDLKTLADKRGVEVSKYYVGLGQHKMAVPPPGEDIVTMAANAAARVLPHVRVEDIDTLLFATESGLDYSKASGIYVHQLLGLSPRCRVVELKQACYSATAAIQLALPMLRQDPSKKVLVIASDIARYGLETTGESSQGGASVAILLSANPRILTIEPVSGFYTKDVMDFWRPNYREEALVDGKYSCDVYMQVLLETWSQYTTATKRGYADFARFCYHTPVPRLVEKSHKWLVKRSNAPATDEELQALLAPALHYNRNIGNSYTASVYVSLLSLLDNDPQDLTDQRIGFYSYGSGCVGEFFAGQVQPGYRDMLDTEYNQALLADRQALSYDQYQQFYTHAIPTDGSEYLLPKYETNQFRLAKVTQHKRCYESTQTVSAAVNLSSNHALTVRTPGKLILSGEHAVVYGNPALAMAINRYTETTVGGQSKDQASQKNILFNLLNFRYYQNRSLSALRLLKQGVHDKYQQFLQGQFGIRDVISQPFELLQFAVTHLLDKRNVNMDVAQGMEVRTDSTIPIGCGMGSSAAAVVSVMYATARFLQLDVDPQSCYQLAWEAENMQHGHSSGVDVYLVLHGGCIRFQKEGAIESRPIPKSHFFLVNTGAPSATTGECVNAAAPFLKDNHALLAEFAQVTAKMEQALEQHNAALFQESVRENHRLLTKIGVVPQKVQRFIHEIEQAGGAAKICGAGSVQGDAAGIVLVASEQDHSDLVRRYDYQHMLVQCESKGTHVI